ncbi:MAG: hypothetical protein HY291_06235 [Planctomycetes bacterium]|nr:hypothetical protein [Planctomycetota bacterium]
MRDRPLFLDVAPLVLLFVAAVLLAIIVIENERGWRVMQEIKKEQAALTEQNRAILSKLTDGLKLQPSGTPETPRETAHETPEFKTGDDLLGEVTEGQRCPEPNGDEKAEDGDWLVTAAQEDPKSLNALIEHAADVSGLFYSAHDSLCGRAFKDLKWWEPHLAHAWAKALVCFAYPKDGNAKALADEINAKWDAALKKKLQIRTITAADAEGRPAVRIAIADVNNDYREVLKKDFGARIFTQWWFYVSFNGPGDFMDGKTITPDAVAELLEAKLAAAGVKGQFLAPVKGSQRVVLRLLGDEKNRDAVAAGLKALEASPDNTCKVIDDKSASGKREDRLLGFEQMEDYLAQEKPVFTFFLRKDVKWHDGKPFSGKDAVWTYNTIMDPRILCGPMRNYYQDLESVALVNDDPYTVRFTWFKPYFRAWSQSAEFVPISEAYYHYDDPKEFNTGPKNMNLVGDGAWQLDHWERQKELVFVRNENYYGAKPHFKRQVVQIIKERQVQLQAFEEGKLDYYNLLPSQMKSRENDEAFRGKFNVNISIANNYRYIGWNERNPLFKDKAVRQALTLLVDRERICKETMRGYAVPQHGTVHPDNPAYWKDLDKHAWPFDPERAKKQLAEAGWKDTDGDGVLDKDGVPFRFSLIIRTAVPEFEALASMVKESFAKAGIEVKVNNLDWSALLEKVNHLNFDAVLLGWQLGSGEEDPYQLWHSSQIHEKEHNFCRFVNKEADQIIEDCRRELNPDKRYAKLQRFQQIILNEQPYTFLFVEKRLVAYDNRIQNVQYRLIGGNSDRWWVPVARQKHKE